VHRCDWHMWQPEGWEFCWRCEELKLKENKKKEDEKLKKNMAKESKICPVCGSQFLDYKSNHRKFCSTKCSDEGRVKNGNSGEKWYQSMSHVDMGKWRGKKNLKQIEKMIGKDPWNKGLTKKNSESVRKYVDKKVGVKKTEETKNKIRLKKIDTKLSEETKNKMSLSARKNIKNKIQTIYKKWHPNYNPNACLVIENYGKENGFNFQHAMNGGEFYIEELGYWVDGYDETNNVVIEYYEKHHNIQISKDKKRKNEIVKFLKCKFIEIWE
jgi:hypothetical protein